MKNRSYDYYKHHKVNNLKEIIDASLLKQDIKRWLKSDKTFDILFIVNPPNKLSQYVLYIIFN